MTEERGNRDTGDAFREGVRTVTGVLGALVETLEHTFNELREGGDLTPERARDAARSTVRKAQDTVEDLRERFDFVPRREFDALRDEVAELRRAIDALRGHASPTGGQEPEPSPAPPEGDREGFPIDEG